MPIGLPRTRDQIENDLFGLAQEYGFSRTDRFVGGFITTIIDSLEENFNILYDLEPQSRIDTSTDEWLQSWARVHGQASEIEQGGEDLSFDNVFIGTADGRAVTEFTLDGQPLFLSSGIQINSSDGRTIMTTLDSIELSGDRAFTRVSIPFGLNITVSPGTYTTGVSLRDFAIRGLQDVPEIVAVVQRPVSSSTQVLSEEDLRAIIFDRARSRNKANNAAIRTTLQIPEVAKVVNKNFNSGSSSLTIYIEPRLGTLSAPLAARVRSYLEELLPNGTRINLSPMIGSLVEMKVRISLPDGFPTTEVEDMKDTVRGRLVALIGQNGTGNTADFSNFLTTVSTEQSLAAISLIDAKVNGRKVALGSYSCRDIEFLYSDALRIEVLA